MEVAVVWIGQDCRLLLSVGKVGDEEVFRVKRAGNFALLVLQWALVCYGIYLIAVTLRVYYYGADLIDQSGSVFVKPLFFSPMTEQEMLRGVAKGLVSAGFGCALFYLRRGRLPRSK